MGDLLAGASALASAVSSIVAIVLAVITYKYLVATRQIRETADLQRMDAQRPAVLLRVSPDDWLRWALGGTRILQIDFWNIGPGPALMVRTSVEYPGRPQGAAAPEQAEYPDDLPLVARHAALPPNMTEAGEDDRRKLRVTEVPAVLACRYKDVFGRTWVTKIDLGQLATPYSVPDAEISLER